MQWQTDTESLRVRSAGDRCRAALARLPEPAQGQAIHAFNRLARAMRSAKTQPRVPAAQGATPLSGSAAAARDETAIAASDAVLASQPFDVPALYYKARACARLGRDEAARAIIRLDEQVRILEPQFPAADAAAFRSALAEEIRRHPSLAHRSSDRATREGAQTHGLLYPGAVQLPVLLAAIRLEIDRLAATASDGFTRAAPERARLAAWAVVYGEGGYQVPHWHRTGWMSGVFYVTGERNAGGRYDGALQLGPYAEDGPGHNPPWGMREIEPVPGRLVIFPSFMPHRTLPARTAGERICVAFDVVPM